MRPLWHSLGAVIFLSLLLTQFTNCDVYSDNSLFQTFTSVCQGQDCIQQNSEFLEIKINSEGDIPIASDVGRFNVGGECNEGGYPSNVITWSLYDDVGFVHNSAKVGKNSECVMGRFKIDILLTDPAQPNPSRTGLRNASGNRVPYRLEVEIRGVDEDGVEHENTLARRQVFLKPI